MIDLRKELNISEDYGNIVMKCNSKNVERNIQCNDINCAIFQSYHLITRARSRINILSQNMMGVTYNNKYIIDALIKASNCGVEIKIILQTDIHSKDMKFFDTHGMRVFQFRKNVKGLFHFLLSDNTAYLVEKHHNLFDFEDNKISRIVNFNDRITCENMNQIFYEIFSTSKKL